MTNSTRRYHDFDALRAFAMLLGIGLHGCLSFMPNPIWPAQDMHQSHTAYSLPVFAIHGFRMPVFFLISGFFTAMMLHKRGVKGLLRHRAKRILLPLILGTIVLWPIIAALGYWATVARQQQAAAHSTSVDIWNASKQGDLDVLKRMIDQGKDANGRDALGVSPLEWAAMHGHPDAITVLVEHGAEVNARNRHGSTALHAAACFGRTDAARKLVELGADPTVENERGDTALDAAQVDMGVVHCIAGLLRMQIDGKAVAAARPETAEYLLALSTPDAERIAQENSPPVAKRGQFWSRLSGLYRGAAFAPVFLHLWFLNSLLWLVGLCVAAAWIRQRLHFVTPEWLITLPWCLLWLIPLTLLPQLFMKEGFGADTAPGLLPWPPKLIYYAVFFGYGALCYGQPAFERKAGRGWPLLFAAALAVLLVGVHFFEVRERSGDPVAHGLTSLCAVTYAWLMVFGLIGLFRRFFTGENRRIRYLSDSSYWLYLAHLPLILGLQISVSHWDIPHFAKFILVCTLTFVVLIISYAYLVRYTFIGTALNGKKTRPPAPEQTHVTDQGVARVAAESRRDRLSILRTAEGLSSAAPGMVKTAPGFATVQSQAKRCARGPLAVRPWQAIGPVS